MAVENSQDRAGLEQWACMKVIGKHSKKAIVQAGLTRRPKGTR
jgi:hypothetical protein